MTVGKTAMLFKAVILLVAVRSSTGLFTTQTPLTIKIARAFPRFRQLVTDEPIDFVDSQEINGSDYNSGFKKDPVSKPVKYYISQEAKEFLTGPLLTAFVPSIYTLVIVISVPLNTIAIIMFAGKIRPCKPAHVFMMNLAVADVLFAFSLFLKVPYHFGGNNWLYGPAMCHIVTSAFYCNMYCSVLLITCIALDRFLAVVHPIRSLTWRSPRNAVLACSAVWLVSCAGVTPVLTYEQTMPVTELNITTCHDVLDFDKQRGFYLYFFPAYSSMFFFVPLIVTTFCYARIIHVLTATSTVNRSNRTRAVVIAATVLVIFVVCFTPTNVILVMHYLQFSHGYSDHSYVAYLISMCIGSVSCCLDPLIYYFGSSQCQKQLVAILLCKAAPETRRTSQSNSTTTSKLDTFQVKFNGPYKKLII